jgi:hypothetical protein
MFKRKMRELASIDGVKLKFYAVGEYGSDTARSNYHLNVFISDQGNIPLNPEKARLYIRKLARKAWPKDKRGGATVRTITGSRIQYVTKYVTKQFNGSLAVRSMEDHRRAMPHGGMVEFTQSKGVGYDATPYYADYLKDQAKVLQSMSLADIERIVEGLTESANNGGKATKKQIADHQNGDSKIDLNQVTAFRSIYDIITGRIRFSLIDVENKKDEGGSKKMPKAWRVKLIEQLKLSEEHWQLFVRAKNQIEKALDEARTPEERERIGKETRYRSKNDEMSFWTRDRKSSNPLT